MTLLMRDQENMEKGIEKGILTMVSAIRDLGNSDITKDYASKYAVLQERGLFGA